MMKFRHHLNPGRSFKRLSAFGVSLAAFTCLHGLAQPAGAAIVAFDLTSVGTPAVNITGANAGISFGTKTVNNFFPSGGTGDLVLYRIPFSTNWAGFGPTGGLKMAVTGGNVSAKAYSLNELIGPTGVTWSDTLAETLLNYAPGGTEQKRGNFSDYIGFQSTVGADTYYAWMKVDWNNTAGLGGVYEILSAAYETTPNLPIPAGSFTSVPGPLPLLGVAAAYAQSRRLRARLRTGSASNS
jgi:hypothetical protein